MLRMIAVLMLTFAFGCAATRHASVTPSNDAATPLFMVFPELESGIMIDQSVWDVALDVAVDRWSIPTPLLLTHRATGGKIVVRSLSSDKETPDEIISDIRSQFSDGEGLSTTMVAATVPVGAAASFAISDTRRRGEGLHPLRAKITVLRLPAPSNTTLILSGYWDPLLHQEMDHQMDLIASKFEAL